MIDSVHNKNFSTKSLGGGINHLVFTALAHFSEFFLGKMLDWLKQTQQILDQSFLSTRVR